MSQDGVIAVSPVGGTFITALPVDNTPPAILDLKISGVSDIDAVISWKTDENASSVLEYGTSTSYGESIDVSKDPVMVHSIRLKELYPSSDYHFVITCIDEQGNEIVSEDVYFQTLELVEVGYEEGNRAPDFTLRSVDGETFSLSDLRGQPVVLNFWRIACPACVYELPFFQEVYEDLNQSQQADKPLIYTVDLMDYEEHVNKLVEQNNFTFPILLDFEGETMRLYGLKSIPMTFFIDSNGIITRVQLGRFDDTDEFREILDKYL
jgi:peroxiredoxin